LVKKFFVDMLAHTS